MLLETSKSGIMLFFFLYVLVFFSIIALFHADKRSYSQAPGNFSVIRKRYNNYWLKYTFNNHLVE